MKVTGMNPQFQFNFLYKIIQILHLSEANISLWCFLTTYNKPKFEYVIISLHKLYGQHKAPIQ
jgi:hypothetical protein